MIAFGHTSSGVLVGLGVYSAYAQSQSPLLLWLLCCVVIGVLAHYVGDFIPHGHYEFRSKHMSLRSHILFGIDFFAIIGLFLAISLARFGISAPVFFITVGIVGAQLPDIWEGLLDIGIVKSSTFSRVHRHWHYKILHWHNDPKSKLPGHGRELSLWDAWQVVVFVVAFVVLTHYHV